MKFLRVILIIIGLSVLSACNFSLAADVTPPPGMEISLPETPVPATDPSKFFPLNPPNLQNGALIYSEKCDPCHGPTGLGDGSLAGNLTESLPAIGSIELGRTSKPTDWYRIVTEGNMEKQMPPFVSLTDAQRWDVVAYVLSLSSSAERISQGQDLYAVNCTDCHGPTGKGDGQAISSQDGKPVDFSNLEWMAGKSSAELFKAISGGVSSTMPGFEEKLSEDERWMLTEHLRSLAFTSSGEPDINTENISPPDTGETTQPGLSSGDAITTTNNLDSTTFTGVITGTVTNASGDGFPADMEILLHGFDDMQVVITQTTMIDDHGLFSFNEVPLKAGRAFLATTELGSVTYGSNIVVAEEGVNSLQLPIEVFESTDDPSDLVLDRLHLFIEPVDNQTLRIVELLIISNSGSKTVVPKDGTNPSVRFALPKGATALEFQDGVLGDRFVETPEGFGDLSAIRPGVGAHQILMAYDLPFNRKFELIKPMLMPANAVVVLVPEESVSVKSDLLEDAGTRMVDNFNYRTYNGSRLEAGESLKMTISGEVSSALPSLAVGNWPEYLIGGSILLFSLILAGVWIYLRSRTEKTTNIPSAESGKTPSFETQETVMDAILTLDDIYRAGELPEDAYRTRRAELKERLQELINNQVS